MQLTEAQYIEILKNPVGTGIFLYRCNKNQVCQLIATRAEIIAYHPKQSRKTKQPKIAPQQQSNYAAAKAATIVALGLLMLLLGAH